MNLKKRLSESYLGCIIKLIRVFLYELLLIYKYPYDGNRDKDYLKLQIDLKIRSHAIEKGMSIGTVKDGFGEKKVIQIIKDLTHYAQLGGEESFMSDVCGIIQRYLEYNCFVGKGMDVEFLFKDFCQKFQVVPSPFGGIIMLSQKDINSSRRQEFPYFSANRFAIRDFGNTPIDSQAIERALKMCEKSPSACNRQPWLIHIINDKIKKTGLLKVQNGANGFADDIQTAILVCCDMRCYNTGETNLPYIDGGLYAMNLLYALHYEGLASIPLSLCYSNKRMKEIRAISEIEDYEVPILLIGVGAYKESFKVAESHRCSYKNYIKYE